MSAAAAAERILDGLATLIDVWKPGSYAGSLYSQLLQAQAAVADINAADRPFYAERLQLIAKRAGVTLAPSSNQAAHIATIKAHATLREIDAALSDLHPKVTVREEAPDAFTVWCDRVSPLAPPPPWLVSEIDSALRLFRNLGVIDSYVLLSAT